MKPASGVMEVRLSCFGQQLDYGNFTAAERLDNPFWTLAAVSAFRR